MQKVRKKYIKSRRKIGEKFREKFKKKKSWTFNYERNRSFHDEKIAIEEK